MKRNIIMTAAVGAILIGAVGQALSNGANEGDEVSIFVAPQTLLLSMEQGGEVTVHTNIPLCGQDAVTLNGVAAQSVYSDNRGHLVAKFSEAAIEALVSPPSAELTLNIDGEDVGSDTVRVVE